MTTIKLKNGSGAPTAGDLVQGEPALDLTNKRLYTEDSGGTVIEVGTNPGTDVTFADNRKAVFGSDSDLQIYHSGSASFISDQGPGPLNILTSGFNVINPGNTETLIDAVENGAVQLYYDNSAKLATTSTGIDVTGTVTADSIGVGIDSPDTLMHLRSTSGAVLRLARQDGSVVANDTLGKIEFYTNDVTNTGVAGYIETQAEGGAAGGALILGTGTAGSSAERMRISASGNVGINTTNPLGKLAVEDSGTGSEIVLSRVGAAAGLYARVGWTGANGLDIGVDNGNVLSASHITMSVDGSEAIRIDNGGNVKVNDGYLEVNTETAAAAVVRVDYNGTDSIRRIHALETGGGNARPLQIHAQDVRFRDDTAERMRIDASGNLLVGTTDTDPASNNVNGFAVSSDGVISASKGNEAVANFSRRISDGDIAVFKKGGTTVGSIGTANGNAFILSNDVGLTFAGGNDAIFPTTSAGAYRDAAIDLGGSGQRFKDLYLSGGAIVGAGSSTAPSITASNDPDAGLFWGGGFLGFTGGSGNQMRLDSSGNLLVGTTDTTIFNHTTGEGVVIGPNAIQISRSSDQMLLLNRMTTSGLVAGFYAAGVGVGSISVTGSATTYNTSSDQRLKDNIVDAPSASDDIDAIQVRSFDWKADGSHQKYGMVAQELQSVAPEAVSGDADSDDMMGVDYSKLVPMLVKEIQSLRARVAQLEGAN